MPTATYYPDQSYLFAFLLSSRLFITPNDLLTRICDICELQQSLKSNLSSVNNHQQQPPDDNQRSSVKCFASHFVQLMQEWTNTFPYDFRDNRLMKQAQKMLQICTSIDATLQNQVTVILQLLAKRLHALEKYDEECSGIKSKYINNDFTDQYNQTDASGGTIHHSTSNNSSTNSSTIDIMELCSTPTQLAHHLTHIELECLSHIGPEEFIQAFAKENSNHLVGLDGGNDSNRSSSSSNASSASVSASVNDAKKSAGTTTATGAQSPKPKTSGTERANTVLHGHGGSGRMRGDDLKKTRNLETYIQWFNRLSYLVASEIVKVCVTHLLVHFDHNFLILPSPIICSIRKRSNVFDWLNIGLKLGGNASTLATSIV